MADSKRCPQCGTDLPADAPEGICPKCLMNLGFGSKPESGSEPSAGQSAAAIDPTLLASGFVPPSVEELARKFPQLEIIELVGKGGMGAVYKARQPGLDRLVAIKILPPTVAADPAFAERFTREARALAKLSHPNIVAVYDFGKADGLYYFVMEFVEGANLRQLILDGGVAPQQALAIVPQICDALQFAHEEGVVHRDIKPENILLDKKGRVKIADFGLAKLLGKESAVGPGGRPVYTLTGTYQVMGTLHYMAPEQIEKPQSVDHRADIYSLGVVFYEMLTGELPIGRFAAPSEMVQVDVRLDEVVLRSLEKEPSRRYQRASDLKSRVQSISSAGTGAPIAPPPMPVGIAAPSVDLEAAKNVVRGPGAALVFVGLVNCAVPLLAALVSLGWILLPYGSSENRPESNPGEGQHFGARIPAIWHGERTPFPVASVGMGTVGPPVFAISATGFAPLLAQEGPSPRAESPVFLRGFMILIAVMAIGSLPVGLIQVLGGLKMRRLELYGMAFTAGLVSLLPCTVAFLASLPCGLWALFVLNRPEVRQAFRQRANGLQPVAVPGASQGASPVSGNASNGGRSGVVAKSAEIAGGSAASPAISPLSAVPREQIVARVRGPATGLFFAGFTMAVIGVCAAAWSGWRIYAIESIPKEPTTQKSGIVTTTISAKADEMARGPVYPGILFLALLTTGMGCVVIFAASSMIRLEYRGLAKLGSVLPMIPLSPAWLWGLPLGMRAFLTLGRKEVRAAFEQRSLASERGEVLETEPVGLFATPPSGLTKFTMVIAVLGGLATFLPWFRLTISGFPMRNPGFESWQGNAAGATFLLLLVAIVMIHVSRRGTGNTSWFSVLAGLIVGGTTGWFIYEAQNPTFTKGPVTTTGDLGPAGAEAMSGLADALVDMIRAQFQMSLEPGVFVSLGCGVILLLVGVAQGIQTRRRGENPAVSD